MNTNETKAIAATTIYFAESMYLSISSIIAYQKSLEIVKFGVSKFLPS